MNTALRVLYEFYIRAGFPFLFFLIAMDFCGYPIVAEWAIVPVKILTMTTLIHQLILRQMRFNWAMLTGYVLTERNLVQRYRKMIYVYINNRDQVLHIMSDDLVVVNAGLIMAIVLTLQASGITMSKSMTIYITLPVLWIFPLLMQHIAVMISMIYSFKKASFGDNEKSEVDSNEILTSSEILARTQNALKEEWKKDFYGVMELTHLKNDLERWKDKIDTLYDRMYPLVFEEADDIFWNINLTAYYLGLPITEQGIRDAVIEYSKTKSNDEDGFLSDLRMGLDDVSH